MICRLLLLFRSYCFPNASSEGATAQRCEDEYPEVLEGLTTGEESGSDRTGRVDGSSGDADAYEMDQHEGKTDCKTGEIASSYLRICCSENDEDEDEGSNKLNDETAERAAGVGNAVCSESCRILDRITEAAEATCIMDNYPKEGSSEDTAENLGNPVTASVLPAHAAGESDTEGDCRVNMATGDASDSISHSNDCKTECECDAYYAGRSAAAKINRCTAAEKSQNHCSNTLCNVLFHLYNKFLVKGFVTR